MGEGTVIAKDTVLLTHDFSIEYGLETIGQTKSDYEMQLLKEIHIGKNCFIGARIFILPEVNIGNNCIIGSESVVSGNIPDNCIYAGIPARFVARTDEWAKRKLGENEFVRGTPKAI